MKRNLILGIVLLLPLTVISQVKIIDSFYLAKKAGNGLQPEGICVNQETNRIYVANHNSDNVSVIDGNTNTVITTIGHMDNPRIIKVNPATNKIYVSSLKRGRVKMANVCVIDGDSNTVSVIIKTGPDIRDIGINPSSNRVYISNSDKHCVYAVDGSTDNVVKKINFQKAIPWNLAVNPVTNRIYVVMEQKVINPQTLIVERSFHDIVVIDGSTDTETDTIRLNLYHRPEDLDVDPNTNRLYVAISRDNHLSVIDCVDHSVISTIPLNEWPTNVDVNSATNRIYIANKNGDNTTVIDGAADSVISAINLRADIHTPCDPWGVGVNQSTNRIYVTDNSGDNVFVIDGNADSLLAKINLREEVPWNIGVNPVTNRVYITNQVKDQVYVMDGASNEIISSITVGDEPWGIGVNPLTDRIYVSNYRDHNISVIDSKVNSVIGTVNVERLPTEITVNPVAKRIHVAAVGPSVCEIDCSIDSMVAVWPATMNIDWGKGWYEINISPGATVMNPKTNRKYAIRPKEDEVIVFDCSGSVDNVIATIKVQRWPDAIDLNPSTNHIFVANSISSSLSVIDGATNSVIKTFKFQKPHWQDHMGIGVNPVTNRIYVCGSYTSAIIVIQDAALKDNP